jgi:hypothetical protein
MAGHGELEVNACTVWPDRCAPPASVTVLAMVASRSPVATINSSSANLALALSVSNIVPPGQIDAALQQARCAL